VTRGGGFGLSGERIEDDVGDPGAAGPIDGPFDDVLQFADVARPRMPEQRLLCGLGKLRGGGELHLRRHPRREMPGEQENVVAAFAKRWHVQHLEREPIEKILLEPPRAGERRQVGVGGADDPHVDAHGAGAPDPLEASVLDGAENFFLCLDRDQPDLVEQQRAAVGGLEPAGPVQDGARERAPVVAKEFSLDEGRGERRAVEGHERRFPAAREVMQLGCGQLLAGASLADEEHGPVDACDPRQVLREDQKRVRLTDGLVDGCHDVV